MYTKSNKSLIKDKSFENYVEDNTRVTNEINEIFSLCAYFF